MTANNITLPEQKIADDIVNIITAIVSNISPVSHERFAKNSG